MYGSKPHLTRGAEAILRSRQKPATPPAGNLRPGVPGSAMPQPVQPMDPIDPNDPMGVKRKPPAVRVRK